MRAPTVFESAVEDGLRRLGGAPVTLTGFSLKDGQTPVLYITEGEGLSVGISHPVVYGVLAEAMDASADVLDWGERPGPHRTGRTVRFQVPRDLWIAAKQAG